MLYKLLVVSAFLFLGAPVSAQRFLSEYDSTLFMRDTVREVVRRFDNLSFSGYIQPQFQVAQEKGIESYAGGNFQEFADNRFMLRRARLKADYKIDSKNSRIPAALFTFQFEATERDVNVRDVFVRMWEPARQNFSLTAGMFSRPFGYEVNLSSSYRETPERGRMSQILMPSERDLGAMVSYESQRPGRKDPQLKFDIGFFNGQGKSGPAEFDSYKDLISRLAVKPLKAGKNISISGGLSLLLGGWAQATKYEYRMEEKNGSKYFSVDSSLSNIGAKAPREYYGADVQLAYNHAWGKTEVRGEYWKGVQPGTATTNTNPGTLPHDPTYIRNFDGAFLYFLQNIINNRWELMAKYDWFDPNTKVAGKEIGKTGTNLTRADVRYHTFGAGLTHYFNNNLKILGYYEVVRNEQTALSGFTKDVNDNVFTLRMQLRF
jgi:predicted porin